MKLYKANIAYDGTGFLGFQRQAEENRTVQAEIERALLRIGWQQASIAAAGRTDRGVHARGQVVSFELSWRHSDQDLMNALNANLPEDIAVWSIAEAPVGFHPRFSARRRRYRYSIFYKRYRDPLAQRYAWRVWPQPDQNLILQTARLFIGRRDFRPFGRAPIPGGHTIRQIFQASWKFSETTGSFDVVADAFLYHMVRRLMAVMINVGQGSASIEDVERLLGNPDLRWEGALAPPNGLSLEEVVYPEAES